MNANTRQPDDPRDHPGNVFRRLPLAGVVTVPPICGRSLRRKREWREAALLVGIDRGWRARCAGSGIAIARWVTSINANFSIPFTGLLAVTVWERAFANKIFSARDWSASWTFGAVGGLALYPMALGLGKFDTYEWGWNFSPLFTGIAALTGLLVWKQNRFGILLVLAIVAYRLRLLESTNYWEYLLDPVYCLVSILVLSWRLGNCCRRRRQPTQR